MIVPGRYNGPPTSANGGYASGLRPACSAARPR
jgi:hypothetical protein